MCAGAHGKVLGNGVADVGACDSLDLFRSVDTAASLFYGEEGYGRTVGVVARASGV